MSSESLVIEKAFQYTKAQGEHSHSKLEAWGNNEELSKQDWNISW